MITPLTTFDRCFAILIGHEGGFARTPSDSGDWTGGIVGVGKLNGTAWGISAASYPTIDIEHLTQDQAKAIYRRDYWAPIHGDDLPAPLALLVFDAAVNNGVTHAAQWLQTAVGVAADGQIGQVTMRAVNAYIATHGAVALCTEVMAQRMFFMGGLSSWRTFGMGWARRLCALPYQAASLA